MNLNYKEFGSGFPIIILHGLLGSLDNWQTIGRKMAELPSAQFKTYIFDQRNHGKSPHTDQFNYDLLSADLLGFFEQQNILKAHLIGHSMGGKTAMKFALEHPNLVEKLIVVDISPSEAEDHHTYIFDALEAAHVHQANTREEVESVLQSKIGDDKTVIQFLMKGLQRDAIEKHFEWKFNLKSLRNHYQEIKGAISGGTPFYGPALFVKGSQSDYINAANYPDIAELFPNNQITEIEGAGHWVQAEKPTEFLHVAEHFLMNS
jgi:esterase